MSKNVCIREDTNLINKIKISENLIKKINFYTILSISTKN